VKSLLLKKVWFTKIGKQLSVYCDYDSKTLSADDRSDLLFYHLGRLQSCLSLLHQCTSNVASKLEKAVLNALLGSLLVVICNVNYFKPKGGLPDLKRLMSICLPMQAITLANKPHA